MSEDDDTILNEINVMFISTLFLLSIHDWQDAMGYADVDGKTDVNLYVDYEDDETFYSKRIKDEIILKYNMGISSEDIAKQLLNEWIEMGCPRTLSENKI